MLGRLSMTVDECIRAYRSLAQQAFTPKRTSIFHAWLSGSFSASALEDAIKRTIREFCVEPECKARRNKGRPTVDTCGHSDALFQSKECTKTYVVDPMQASFFFFFSYPS